MTDRSRAEDGHLLNEDDPRVQAALPGCIAIASAVDSHGAEDGWDWRDAAEIVNAVLAADDRMHE